MTAPAGKNILILHDSDDPYHSEIVAFTNVPRVHVDVIDRANYEDMEKQELIDLLARISHFPPSRARDNEIAILGEHLAEIYSNEAYDPWNLT